LSASIVTNSLANWSATVRTLIQRPSGSRWATKFNDNFWFGRNA
jgi:hypothetical protein